ncbi:uncharacterized protein PFL1_02854 [Pseudozyma flocculosa PF-1]|uniref:Related to mitochondrial import receptor subunit TOM20 n=2 Tax=Pseudozyma flocculosa TaxID=84751 RepID=A0A5C3F1N6_9BASI|nr:uncharacterized protein PFL1_02854 [Pseudozyma flocculosa PF-1]EPQ29635.1 hypothetical protein PFL1_02854 [Pseudozyma flocculosa PF-1]SPO38202.1 related to mitochondrial import receptor subunit TOM20 [Pseudozyma flocculosa]
MKTSQVVITSLSLLTAGALGYAIYFDYKRQTDATFRKSLKKDSKKTSKASKKEAERRAKAEEAVIQQLLDEIRQPGVLPADIEAKEQYFLQHVSLGEQLFAQGPEHYLDASIAFFKALKAYPAPVELIMIYQKAVPKEVFDCIMRIVSKDIAMGGGEDGAGPSAAAGLAGQSVGNLDDVDEDGPSAAAAEVHAAEKAKQASGADDGDDDDNSGAHATSAAKDETAPSAPASSTAASSSNQQSQQNNGTDSGTTSSQEWDTLSANSLNDTGVFVPSSQQAATPAAAAASSEADETTSVETAEAAAPEAKVVEESATPVETEQPTPAESSETTYEKTEEQLAAPVDTVGAEAEAEAEAADGEDQWEDEEKKASN